MADAASIFSTQTYPTTPPANATPAPGACSTPLTYTYAIEGANAAYAHIAGNATAGTYTVTPDAALWSAPEAPASVVVQVKVTATDNIGNKASRITNLTIYKAFYLGNVDTWIPVATKTIDKPIALSSVGISEAFIDGATVAYTNWTLTEISGSETSTGTDLVPADITFYHGGTPHVSAIRFTIPNTVAGKSYNFSGTLQLTNGGVTKDAVIAGVVNIKAPELYVEMVPAQVVNMPAAIYYKESTVTTSTLTFTDVLKLDNVRNISTTFGGENSPIYEIPTDSAKVYSDYAATTRIMSASVPPVAWNTTQTSYVKAELSSGQMVDVQVLKGTTVASKVGVLGQFQYQFKKIGVGTVTPSVVDIPYKTNNSDKAELRDALVIKTAATLANVAGTLISGTNAPISTITYVAENINYAQNVPDPNPMLTGLPTSLIDNIDADGTVTVIETNFASWSELNPVHQFVTVTVTDIFGGTVEATVRINFYNVTSIAE